MNCSSNKFIFFFLLLTINVFAVAFLTEENYTPKPYQLQYNEEMGKPYIPFNNPLTEEGVWLGRLLFYDTLLSGNNKQSCGTCHLQQYAFTDGKPLAVGTYGDAVDRNTMSLVNLAWGIKFFWDGRASLLEELIQFPVTNSKEMAQDTVELVKELKRHKHYPVLFSRAFPNEEISMNTISKALAQFLRTLVSQGIMLPDSIFDKSEYSNTDSVVLVQQYSKENSLRGSFTRMAIMCSNCHSGLSYGGATFADNHIVEELSLKHHHLLMLCLPRLICAMADLQQLQKYCSTMKNIFLHGKKTTRN